MKQPIVDYFDEFLCDINFKHESLTDFIDFVIINEIRFLDFYELNAIIKYFAQDNPIDKQTDLVFENYMYGDIQSRIKHINFNLLYDELENIFKIRDKFIDEIDYSSDLEKRFIQKDSEALLDIFYDRLKYYAMNLSKYSFRKYFLYDDYFDLLENRESTIKLKLAKEILRAHYNPINIEELSKKLIYIVLLEINGSDVPIKEISFAERYEQILSIQTNELVELELSAENWYKDFRKTLGDLVLKDLIAKNSTIQIIEEKVNYFGESLLFDMISLSKFGNILQVQNNNKYLQIVQNNPVVENTKNFIKENFDSPFSFDKLRDFVKKEMNNVLMLINDIAQNEEDVLYYEEGEIITPEQLEKQEELYREELAYISFDAQERAIENALIERLKNIMTNNFSSNGDQELNQFSKDFFKYCLDKSNKNVTFEEISNVDITDIINNSNKIHYAPIYASIKKTMQSVSETVKNNNVQNNFQSASYMFYELSNLVIPQINNI